MDGYEQAFWDYLLGLNQQTPQTDDTFGDFGAPANGGGPPPTPQFGAGLDAAAYQDAEGVVHLKPIEKSTPQFMPITLVPPRTTGDVPPPSIVDTTPTEEMEVEVEGATDTRPAPETKPGDVPLVGWLAGALSPEDPTRAPIVGPFARALSDITRPTSGPKLLDALQASGGLFNQVGATVNEIAENAVKDKDATFGKKLGKEFGVGEEVGAGIWRAHGAVGGSLNALGGATNAVLAPIMGIGNELRDLPVIGALYRVGLEAPLNVLNEATIPTAGLLLAWGNILGRSISDTAGWYGSKGISDPNGRVGEYLRQMDENAKKSARGNATQVGDYLTGTFKQASPLEQLFTTLVNPLNVIDVFPIGALQRLRAGARATGQVILPEQRAFGKTLIPRVKVTGENAPLVVRMLFDLPKLEKTETGGRVMLSAEKLGIYKPGWWDNVMPQAMSEKARGYEMLRRTLDNFDARMVNLDAEGFRTLLDNAVTSARSGKLGRDFFAKFPQMAGKDAMTATHLTGAFDVAGAWNDVTKAQEWALKALAENTPLDDKMPRIWKSAVESLRTNKTLDAIRVLDTAAKYDLRYKWGKHVATAIRVGLGITNPGVIKKMFDGLRQWEGALYIGMNPGVWIRNGWDNKKNLVLYGINPFTDYKKIQETYKQIGWDPFSEIRAELKGVVAPETGGSSAFGASVPKKLEELLPWYSRIEEADRKIAYWSGFDKTWRGNWRRGNWFKRMPIELEKSLDAVSPRLSNLVYGAIESGRSPQQVFEKVNELFRAVHVEALMGDPQFASAVGQVLGAQGALSEDVVRLVMASHADGINDAIARAFARTDVPREQALTEELTRYRDSLLEHHQTLRGQEAPNLREAARQGATQSDPEYQQVLERARKLEQAQTPQGAASVPQVWRISEELRASEYANVADAQLPKTAEELAYDETRRQLETKGRYDKDRAIRKTEKAHPEWKEAYEERWGSGELPAPIVEVVETPAQFDAGKVSVDRTRSGVSRRDAIEQARQEAGMVENAATLKMALSAGGGTHVRLNDGTISQVNPLMRTPGEHGVLLADGNFADTNVIAEVLDRNGKTIWKRDAAQAVAPLEPIGAPQTTGLGAKESFEQFHREIDKRGLRDKYIEASDASRAAVRLERHAQERFDALRHAIAEVEGTPVDFYAKTVLDWNRQYHLALGDNETTIAKARDALVKKVSGKFGVFPTGRLDQATSAALSKYGLELAAKIRKEAPQLADTLARDVQTKAQFVWDKILNGDYAKFSPAIEQQMFARVRDGDRILRALTNNERGLDLTGLRGYTEGEVLRGPERATLEAGSGALAPPARTAEISGTLPAEPLGELPANVGGVDSGIGGTAGTEQGLPTRPGVTSGDTGIPVGEGTGTSTALNTEPITPTTTATQFNPGDAVTFNGKTWRVDEFSAETGRLRLSRGNTREWVLPDQVTRKGAGVPNEQGLESSTLPSGAGVAGERASDSIPNVERVAGETVAPADAGFEGIAADTDIDAETMQAAQVIKGGAPELVSKPTEAELLRGQAKVGVQLSQLQQQNRALTPDELKSLYEQYLLSSDDMPAAMGPNVADAAAEDIRTLDALLPLVHQGVMAAALKNPVVLDPITARALAEYLGKEINPALADATAGANVVGRWNMGRTVLNYDARTNFDEWMSYVFPFLYWRRAQMSNWAQRFLEKPNLWNAYVRAQQALDDQTNSDEFPARLRGKLRLPMPFMEKWMGGNIYFDPLEAFMPLQSIYGAELQRAKYSNARSALLGLPASDDDVAKVLRSKAQRGELNRGDVENAIANKSGDLWEQAKQEAQVDVASPDNLTGLFTPHTPFQWIIAALTNNTDAIGPLLPLSRPIRQLTGALGLNNGAGVNIEAPARNVLRGLGLTNLPEFDPWEEYRTRRELANMVADGAMLNNQTITEKDAKLAMLEKSGVWWNEAQRRANASRMPLMSMFTPTTVYPTGEQGIAKAKKGLDALKRLEIARLGSNPDNMTYSEMETLLRMNGAYTQGGALNRFYDAHPELGARSAVFQEPEELLKKWVIDELWTKYNDLSALDRRAVRAQLGDDFQTLFANKETRDYDQIELLDLIRWGQQMDVLIPHVPKGDVEILDLARVENQNKLKYAPPALAAAYQNFTQAVNAQFDSDEMARLGDEYRGLTERADKQEFLKRNPLYAAYLTAWTKFYDANPQVKEFLRGVGAMESSPSLGAGASKEQQFYYTIVASGLDWELMKAKEKAYSALPKGTGARSQFLRDNPDYKRYYDLRNAFFGDSETYGSYFDPAATRASPRTPKVYDPNDYIREVTPQRTYAAWANTPRFGSAEMFAALARARKKYSDRFSQQDEDGQARAPSQYRMSPRL